MLEVRRMKRTLALLVILLSLTASCLIATRLASAEAKTIVVPDDYPTIAAAIGNASQGDTVFVKKGTYNEKLVIDKALKLQGEDKANTIIQGVKIKNDSGIVVQIRHDNVDFSGFTVLTDKTNNSPEQAWFFSSRLRGIHLLSVKNCNVSGNKVEGANCGIWLFEATENSVTDNYLDRNDYGIRLEGSADNNLSGNTAADSWGGIWLISSAGNTLRDNQMQNNSRNFLIEGNAASDFVNDVDASNTVDGRPIVYWMNVADRAVPSDAGCLVLVNCTNMKIQGLHLSNNRDGIILVGTSNTLVADNTIAECDYGIETYNSAYTNIVGNVITGSRSGSGIVTHNALWDNITENIVDTDLGNGIFVNGNGTKILSNNITAGSGVAISGFYQTVADNSIIIKAWEGFMIQCGGSYTNITHNNMVGTSTPSTPSHASSTIDGANNVFYENVMTNAYQLRVTNDGNIIANNNVTSITINGGSGNVVCANKITNGYRGLGVGGHNNVYYANQVENNRDVSIEIIGVEALVSNNTIYHNNFVNNKQQFDTFSGNKANFWDNGSEGNYWSDYNGTDANSDGIGDIPYLIEGKVYYTTGEILIGKDNYPLMAPFNINSVVVTLPEWNYTPPTPQPTRNSMPTPSNTPTSTQANSPLLSPSTTQLTPNDSDLQQAAFPWATVFVVVGAAVVIVVVAVMVLLLWRRK